MEMPSARRWASTIRCWPIDDAALQAERDRAILAQQPDLALWVPCRTGLLHAVADYHLGKGDA